MEPSSAFADRLQAAIVSAVPIKPWPGGYPDEVDAALIDAVFSIRARYGRRDDARPTGVFGAVQRWRARRPTPDDLAALASFGAEELRAVTNGGKAGGRYKADIVTDSARRFTNAGIVTAADLRERNDEAEGIYRSVHGCGPVTWRYLRMLVGASDVKPDNWVMRFVHDVLPASVDNVQAVALLTAVAARMAIDVRVLDHSIWLYRRSL